MSLDTKRILYNISALVDLGQEATSSKDFDVKMLSSLHVVMGSFLAYKGAIFGYDPGKDTLVTIASKGLTGLKGRLKAGPEVLGLEKNGPVSLGRSEDSLEGSLLYRKLFKAGIYVLVPLWARDRFMGALALSDKFTAEPYGAEDFELLKVTANQIATMLHNHALFADLSVKLDENRKLYEEMRLIYHDTIQAFAAAIDAKDVYTKNHSYRVARYVVGIAKELGWGENEVEGLYIAGLLHDVGKIILSVDILNKEGPLSHDDIEEIKRHPKLSYKILSNIKFPWKDVVRIIRQHHERPDGKGYPDALKDGSLSIGVKILTLADSFDAMTTSRPYRRRMDLRLAIEELKRCLGTQFDPVVMAAFCRVLEKEIKGDLDEPDILPHLSRDFDPSVITAMLEAIRLELSGAALSQQQV